jgi:hypothetical protein
MLLQLRKLAVQSIATPADIVILTNISEGVEGATVFGITEEEVNPIKILDGQTALTAYRHTINIRGLYDDADMAQLKTWALAQEPVRITGLGVNGAIIFDGDYLLAVNTGFDSINTVALKVTVEWANEFTSGYQQIAIGQNLLRNYLVNLGTGTLLYGFTADAGVTPTYSGGNQTVTYVSGSDNGVKSDAVFFPFEGEQLTASASFTAQTGTWAIGFRFLDSAGALISQSTTAFGIGDVPGRNTKTATVPAGTFFVQFVVVEGVTSAADATTFNTPQIALGTLATYTNF